MNKNDLRLTVKQRRVIWRQMAALDEVLSALTPLDFDARRRLMRWVCDYYMIDPTKLPLTP